MRMLWGKEKRGMCIIDDRTCTSLKLWFCHSVLVRVAWGSRVLFRIRTATLTAWPRPEDSFSVQRSKVSFSEQRGEGRQDSYGNINSSLLQTFLTFKWRRMTWGIFLHFRFKESVTGFFGGRMKEGECRTSYCKWVLPLLYKLSSHLELFFIH